MRILFVEDSKPLQKYVAKGLRQRGFAVDVAPDGEEGLFFAESGDYDVIVLDLMLPKMDGLSVLRRLRERNCSTYVLILTAKDTVDDRVKGLGDGADDYLIKPFAFDELVARIQALLRRSYNIKTTRLIFGDLEIDIRCGPLQNPEFNLDLRPRSILCWNFLHCEAAV